MALFHTGLLPREGFHADSLGKLLGRTLLSPALILPCVLALRYAARGQQFAAQYPRLASFARICAALAFVRSTNNFLDKKVLNNGVDDKYDWKKEVVLITGGSDGIGKQVVLMLATKGVKVVVLDIQPLTYDPPATVTYFNCDITSTSSISSVASQIRVQVGTPTVLINNAGVCRGKPLLENTDNDLNLTFDVNTIAHYKLAREFVPSMVEANHGMIVTVASSAAWVTAPRMTEYAASKAAALSFHEGISAELVATYKAPKVRTVVVNQGYTRTSLFQGFGVKENAFFGPSLHVDTVAQAIAEQVLSGKSGQIILPSFYKFLVQHFRSLPGWMAHDGRRKMDNLMSKWNGRQVPVPVPIEAAERA